MTKPLKHPLMRALEALIESQAQELRDLHAVLAERDARIADLSDQVFELETNHEQHCGYRRAAELAVKSLKDIVHHLESAKG